LAVGRADKAGKKGKNKQDDEVWLGRATFLLGKCGAGLPLAFF
jgi:hypothetical protein